ncbi:helix-turn-helix domain-containing protein [Lysinibacillus fusiformis]|uniref:helix-turn-helix domain-containing protein n=1 Tax=Lysinibacillus fusiformis TaxID=28031 RepID=UPI003CFF9FD1
MTEQKQTIEAQTALPYKYDGGWTGIPNAIFEIYAFHPKYTPACTNVYLFLLHRHNKRYGYAFPTQDQIADALCTSRSTVSTAIGTLKRLGLIDVERHPDHDNVVYFFKRPIDNRQSFETQVFGRKVGEAGNTKLGDALRNINMYLEKIDIDKLAERLGDKLGVLTDKAIAFGKLLWQWREPIVYVVGAIAAAVGTLAGVGVIAALANPVSLIAAGIAAAVVGFKELYDNSEMFRGAIDGIVGKVKSLWSAFKTGGTGGLISALFPPNIANQINSLVGGIKAKISGLMTAFKTGGFKGVLEMLISPEAISAMTSRFATIKEQVISVFTSLVEAVLPVLQTLWSTAQPILSALWDALKIVADVVMLAWNNIIAPTITFVMKTFKLMWSVIGPILELLGAAFKILRLVWDTIVGPFVAFLAGGFTQAFGAATEIVNALSPVF